jgi:hypothetical protein
MTAAQKLGEAVYKHEQEKATTEGGAKGEEAKAEDIKGEEKKDKKGKEGAEEGEVVKE